jgi:hypothetical protein
MIVPREIMLAEGLNGFFQCGNARGIADFIEHAAHHGIVAPVVPGDAGLDDPLARYDRKVDFVPGFRRQRSHEGSVCASVSFAEGMHAVEIDDHAGGGARIPRVKCHADNWGRAVIRRYDQGPRVSSVRP